MKTANTFWKIFLLLHFSNSWISPEPDNPDSQRVPSPIPCAVTFYQPKPQREFGLKYFSTVNLTKIYHYEAVSSFVREVKRNTAMRYPEPENGTTEVLFPATKYNLILSETILDFIFHQLKVIGQKKLWFNQHQF
jgi:hypothetical protein